jgi:hypothetical protein
MASQHLSGTDLSPYGLVNIPAPFFVEYRLCHLVSLLGGEFTIHCRPEQKVPEHIFSLPLQFTSEGHHTTSLKGFSKIWAAI